MFLFFRSHVITIYISIKITFTSFLVIHLFFQIYIKQTKNNKRKRNTYLDTRGMPSPPSWLLSWLLNEVAGCGGAGTEPPNFDFCCCYCCWKLAISCPMLTFGQRKTYVLLDAHFRLLHNLAPDSCGSSLIKYLGSLLKMRILVVVPPRVALPMVMPASSAKPVLVLSLILI